MSAPEMSQEGKSGEQMAQKAPNDGAQMAQTGVRDRADSGYERVTTSFFSYSDCPLLVFLVKQRPMCTKPMYFAVF